jgi:hypothetical protein
VELKRTRQQKENLVWMRCTEAGDQGDQMRL